MRALRAAVLLIVMLWAAAAQASPGPDHVIPPGRETAAQALLRDAPTPDGLHWLGPTIEVDRIKWWLMAGEQARAIIVLLPRALAAEEDPLSDSFAIAVAWAPDVEPTPAERAAIEQAIVSIQAHDRGEFYIAPEAGVREGGTPPYLVAHAHAPEVVRNRWTLKLIGVAALICLGLAIVLRRQPPLAEQP
jgi:hypothetical protein